jgi:kynurenine formamidase
MRFRSFIIAYALVLALLLFADRRPTMPQNHYSQVVDLTAGSASVSGPQSSGTRIISPAALIPGTWGAAQIPAERLIAPLVVMDLNSSAQLSVDDISAWETRHGNVPQGAIVALRNKGNSQAPSAGQFPVNADAAQFLMDARYTLGFVVENPADLERDRTLARQIALHGNYVVEGSARMTTLPETGSLIIVAPMKTTSASTTPVRVLAMVR